MSSEHWHFAAATQEALWITSHKEKRQSDIVSFSLQCIENYSGSLNIVQTHKAWFYYDAILPKNMWFYNEIPKWDFCHAFLACSLV